ncbi:unnamed protein product [Amoebophrya sp. A25]|nr:unnamed protein product [Amoebophrya sp. A25]|eukprot:GSA25T00013981001.1
MARLTMLKAKNKPSDGKSVELVASSGPSTSSTKPKAYAPWIVSGKLPNGTLFEEQFYEGMEIPLPYCFVSLGRFRFQLQERLLNILNGNTAGPLDGGSHPPMKGNNNHMGNQLYSNTNRGSGHQNSGPHHQSRAVLLTGPNGDGGLQTGPTGRSDETTPQHSSSMSGASLVISSSTTPGGQHRQQHSTRLVESGAPDAATSQLVQQVLSALPRTGGQPQQVIVHHQRPATGGTITGTPGAPLVLVHDSRASPSVQVQYATPVQQPQVVHLVSAEDTRWARSVSTGPLTPASMTMNATTSTNIRLVPASQVRGRSVSSMSGATGGGLTTSNAKSNKKRDYSQQKGSSSASSSSSAHDDRYGADVATPRGTPKRKRRKNADPRVYGVGDASSAPTGSIFVNGSVVGTSSAAASQFVRGVGGQSYIAQSVLPQHQTILHQGGPTSLATALSAASFGTQNARDLVQQASAAGTAASSPIIPARQATAGTVWMSDADLQFQ